MNEEKMNITEGKVSKDPGEAISFLFMQKELLVTSVMSNSVRPHRWQPTRLPHPWDSPGKNTGVDCHFLLQSIKVKSESEVAQSCLTLSDPMNCSPSGSSVYGIFQARVLEWGAIAFSGITMQIWGNVQLQMNCSRWRWDTRQRA